MQKKLHDDINETIGDTPLVRLNRAAATYTRKPTFSSSSKGFIPAQP
jgi:hypothetical protein